LLQVFKVPLVHKALADFLELAVMMVKWDYLAKLVLKVPEELLANPAKMVVPALKVK
jgi:hypothetical protein